MRVDISKAVVRIQQQIYEQNKGLRTDAHYKEGKGVLFVPEFAPLIPQNVIFVADEMMLMMYGL